MLDHLVGILFWKRVLPNLVPFFFPERHENANSHLPKPSCGLTNSSVEFESMESRAQGLPRFVPDTHTG